MKEDRLIELAEKYVLGILNQEELKELNNYINYSNQNKEKFEEQVRFIQDINKYYNTLRLKKTLETVSEQFEQNNIRKKAKLYDLIVRYTSIAAVSIIAVLFTLYFSGWFSFKNQVKTYRQLSNTITTISKKQKSLWDNLFSTNQITFVRGTAFSLSPDGLLATSYHLVKDFDSVLVVNALDSSLKMHAKLVAFDEHLDVAILKISDSTFSGIQNIPYTINYNFPFELGNYVYSLGFSKSSIVFGEGSISSFTGYSEDSNSIQISIPTNPGNSGSPVFNQHGEVIGIICGKNYDKEGSSYALRSSVLKNILDSLNKENIYKSQNKNTLKSLPKNKQISKILPYIFKIEIY